MECNICGRQTQNDNVNFCENCGNSFRENYQGFNQKDNYYQQRNTNSYNQQDFQNKPTQKNENRVAPVSFGNWLITLALPFILIFVPIPFVGPIAYIVLLAVWAFGNNTNPNKKNWAKANLLVTIVVGILFIIFSVSIFTSILDGSLPIEGFEGFEGFEGLEGFGEGNNFY